MCYLASRRHHESRVGRVLSALRLDVSLPILGLVLRHAFTSGCTFPVTLLALRLPPDLVVARARIGNGAVRLFRRAQHLHDVVSEAEGSEVLQHWIGDAPPPPSAVLIGLLYGVDFAASTLRH